MKLEMASHPLYAICELFLYSIFYLTSQLIKLTISTLVFFYHAIYKLISTFLQGSTFVFRIFILVQVLMFSVVNELFNALFEMFADIKPESSFFKFLWVYGCLMPLNLFVKMINLTLNMIHRFYGCLVKGYCLIIKLIVDIMEVFDFQNHSIKVLLLSANFKLYDQFFDSILFTAASTCIDCENIYAKGSAYLVELSDQSKSLNELTPKHKRIYSWWGLITTKFIKLCNLVASFALDFSFGLLENVLELFRKKVNVLKDYSASFYDEINHFHSVLCEKTDANKAWVDSWTDVIMFIPNSLISLMILVVEFSLKLNKIAISLVKIPIIFCLEIMFNFSKLLESYVSSEDIHSTKLLKPTRKELAVYDLVEDEVCKVRLTQKRITFDETVITSFKK